MISCNRNSFKKVDILNKEGGDIMKNCSHNYELIFSDRNKCKIYRCEKCYNMARSMTLGEILKITKGLPATSKK
ncbi:hypothetical protein [Paraclostridium bifermentans]|uniref:hypothetical protein n=1 Tax=Paraclostridium bifermentans TaxID=1490 RepID=UPI00189927F7|nr:hypothetical protein [Paraclostridium bifermentans]